jgi:hypothetical protein
MVIVETAELLLVRTTTAISAAMKYVSSAWTLTLKIITELLPTNCKMWYNIPTPIMALNKNPERKI